MVVALKYFFGNLLVVKFNVLCFHFVKKCIF